jgi:NADPH:quinone reductase-like Zn-dependent oxidoreductase
MRCISVEGSESSAGLVTRNVPEPRPGRKELLIRVCAAGVTPTELRWYPTWHQRSGEKRSDAVPGHEFSGIVAAVGDEVGSLEVGREVFGMNDWYSDGALEDYCIAPFFAVAPKPARLTDFEAASVPIGALTAWQALFDHAKLQPGDRVLVHGGAGGVGVFAIQLARLHGAHVMATASGRHIDFVSSLGAHEVIDYRASRFEDVVKQADVVLDTVGGETLERSWKVLAPGGRLMTITSTAAASDDERVKKAFFIVEANQKQLYEIGALLEKGTLRPFVDAVVPLSQAQDAYSGRVERQGHGKIVVAVLPTEERTT